MPNTERKRKNEFVDESNKRNRKETDKDVLNQLSQLLNSDKSLEPDLDAFKEMELAQTNLIGLIDINDSEMLLQDAIHNCIEMHGDIEEFLDTQKKFLAFDLTKNFIFLLSIALHLDHDNKYIDYLYEENKWLNEYLISRLQNIVHWEKYQVLTTLNKLNLCYLIKYYPQSHQDIAKACLKLSLVFLKQAFENNHTEPLPLVELAFKFSEISDKITESHDALKTCIDQIIQWAKAVEKSQAQRVISVCSEVKEIIDATKSDDFNSLQSKLYDRLGKAYLEQSHKVEQPDVAYLLRQSIYYFTMAEKLINKNSPDKKNFEHMLSTVNVKLGMHYLSNRNYQKSYQSLKLGLTYAQNCGEIRKIAYAEHSLAKYHSSRGEKDKAVLFSKNATQDLKKYLSDRHLYKEKKSPAHKNNSRNRDDAINDCMRFFNQYYTSKNKSRAHKTNPKLSFR